VERSVGDGGGYSDNPDLADTLHSKRIEAVRVPDEEYIDVDLPNVNLEQLGDSIRSWGPADGLAGLILFVIREVRDGSIWIGTSGGLTRVRDGMLARIGAEQGLPSELVAAIEESDGRSQRSRMA